MGIKPSIFQPGHDGQMKPSTVPVSAAHHSSDRSHELVEGNNLARSGGKAKGSAVPIHPGMRVNTHFNAGIGMTNTTGVPDAAGPIAQDYTKPGKAFVGRPVPFYPGMRHQSGLSADDCHAIGSAIVREAQRTK